MQQRLSRFRPYGFFLILLIVAICLYVSNRQTALFLQSVQTGASANVALRLYDGPFFFFSWILAWLPASIPPFLLLFIGMTGMFQLLASLNIFSNRYVPFVGSIFYALSPLSLWLFSSISLPLLFLFAFLPWQIWILLQFMHESSLRRSTKLILFFLIQLGTAPAYSYPGGFTFVLVLISLFCVGLSLSRSFFTLISRSPWYVLLIIFLNLYWFLPRLYLLINSTLINPSSPELTLTQFVVSITHQPLPILAVQVVLALIVLIGLLRPTRYSIPFLLTSLILSLPYWLSISGDIPYVHSFIDAAFLPVIAFFLMVSSFLFVNGLAMILAVIAFIKKHRRKSHQVPALPPFHSLMKSPFEIYQEIIEETHTAHGVKHFTPLQFTEHFLHHLLTMKTQTKETSHHKYWAARYLCYGVFVLLILSGFSAFQGAYFGQRKLASAPLVKTKSEPQEKNVAALFQNVPNIGPAMAGITEEYAYLHHGNYITRDDAPVDVYYPFRIINGRNFSFTDKEITLTQEIQQNQMKHLGEYDLESATESATVSLITSKGETVSFESSSYAEMNGDNLAFTFERHLITVVTSTQLQASACPERTKTGCYAFKHAGLSHQNGYLITLSSPLPFFVQNSKQTQTYLEEDSTAKEQTVVLPPSFSSESGYTLIIGSAPPKDWRMQIDYLPYQDIQATRFVHKNGIHQGKKGPSIGVKHYNESVNEVQIPPLKDASNTVLAFYQGFDSGWSAYKINPSTLKNFWDRWLLKIYPFTYAKELGTHVMVNNWANGWQLNKNWSDSTILLIFWPQYLEYAGLVILGVFFLIFTVSWVIGWYRRLQE